MESGGLFELFIEIAMVLIGGWIALGAVRGGGNTNTAGHWDEDDWIEQ